jgi:hypothetical protein
MRNLKKILPALVAACVLLGATPALAQVAGVWQGEGSGNAYPHPGTVIYPWQNWKGEIPNTQDEFTGVWYDGLGNHGIFKGEVEFSPIPEIALAKGAWYWYDPLGPSSQPVYGGKFEMTFYFLADYCKGTWTTIWPSTSAQGTMKGERVE